MNTENETIQRQRSNGSWADISPERVDDYLAKIVKTNDDIHTKEDALEALRSGKKLRHRSSDWYAVVRLKPEAKTAPEVDTWDRGINPSTGICGTCGYASYECECR